MIRRRSWLRTTSTYSILNATVGTTRKSIDAKQSTWLSRNVRHVCDGVFRGRNICLDTVASDTSKPSFSDPSDRFKIAQRKALAKLAKRPKALRWRITNVLRHARELLDPDPVLDPMRRALATFETHMARILDRWTSTHSNARLEGINGLFQAARARARGYRKTTTFATTIYLIAAPLGNLFIST